MQLRQMWGKERANSTKSSSREVQSSLCIVSDGNVHYSRTPIKTQATTRPRDPTTGHVQYTGDTHASTRLGERYEGSVPSTRRFRQRTSPLPSTHVAGLLQHRRQRGGAVRGPASQQRAANGDAAHQRRVGQLLLGGGHAHVGHDDDGGYEVQDALRPSRGSRRSGPRWQGHALCMQQALQVLLGRAFGCDGDNRALASASNKRPHKVNAVGCVTTIWTERKRQPTHTRKQSNTPHARSGAKGPPSVPIEHAARRCQQLQQGAGPGSCRTKTRGRTGSPAPASDTACGPTPIRYHRSNAVLLTTLKHPNYPRRHTILRARPQQRADRNSRTRWRQRHFHTPLSGRCPARRSRPSSRARYTTEGTFAARPVRGRNQRRGNCGGDVARKAQHSAAPGPRNGGEKRAASDGSRTASNAPRDCRTCATSQRVHTPLHGGNTTKETPCQCHQQSAPSPSHPLTHSLTHTPRTRTHHGAPTNGFRALQTLLEGASIPSSSC